MKIVLSAVLIINIVLALITLNFSAFTGWLIVAVWFFLPGPPPNYHTMK